MRLDKQGQTPSANDRDRSSRSCLLYQKETAGDPPAVHISKFKVIPANKDIFREVCTDWSTFNPCADLEVTVIRWVIKADVVNLGI